MHKYITLSFLLFILLAGCARQQLQPTVTLEDFKQESAQSSPSDSNKFVPQGKFSPVEAMKDGTNFSENILGPGDLLTITVFETEELNNETRISARGDIVMPLLGRINVEGLTASEAEKKIEDALVREYMHTAHVSLFVKEKMNQQITLVGAVKQPGTFETQSRKKILEVLALAGGVTQAAGDTAYVTRKNRKDDSNQIFVVDLDALLTQGRVDMNMIVQGGDVIFIPESDQIQVDGAVRRPGSYKIDGKMSIDSAIATAGGLANYADEDDIKLIRKNNEGNREIVQLSMNNIIGMKKDGNKSGNNAPWQELLLRDGDVIFVEASGTRSFYSGVGFSIGFMGTGVTFSNPVK